MAGYDDSDWMPAIRSNRFSADATEPPRLQA
jgi:hypothetical protein